MSVLTSNGPETVAKTPKAPTRKQAENALKRYAEVAEVKAKLEAETKAKTADLGVELAALETTLRAYADAHRHELAPGRKSLDLDNGRLSWSLNPGKLVYALTSDEEKVLDYLEGALPRGVQRQVVAAAVRQAWDLDMPGFRTELTKLGVEVVREERFTVKVSQD